MAFSLLDRHGVKATVKDLTCKAKTKTVDLTSKKKIMDFLMMHQCKTNDWPTTTHFFLA